MKSLTTSLLLLTSVLWLNGCQLPYLFKSAYYQSKLLKERVPLEEALMSEKIDSEQKRKLRLVDEVKKFAESKLGLKPTKNYQSYVQLDGPYVTYIVRASPYDKLEHHLWSFPIVGQVPYKGFFKKQDAEEEAKDFSADKFDVAIRGVTAYSTLGWFRDPILSSMLAYEDHDVVNLIIHETVHATIYIKNQADFNERLATYIGNVGTELFYREREGASSASLQKIKDDAQDERLFSAFISEEIGELKKWYLSARPPLDKNLKAAKLNEIKQKFKQDLQPKMKTKHYIDFSEQPLNNAILLGYQTYLYDLTDFERLFELMAGDFKALLAYCKNLEKSKAPEDELKKFISNK